MDRDSQPATFVSMSHHAPSGLDLQTVSAAASCRAAAPAGFQISPELAFPTIDVPRALDVQLHAKTTCMRITARPSTHAWSICCMLMTRVLTAHAICSCAAAEKLQLAAWNLLLGCCHVAGLLHHRFRPHHEEWQVRDLPLTPVSCISLISCCAPSPSLSLPFLSSDLAQNTPH